jgi:FtsZ-interacting cell division protein ZipA
MPVWQWILIVVGIFVLVAVVILALSMNRRKKSEGLQQRFGPEYQRTVSETGDTHRAEKQLADREHQRAKLDIVALDPESAQHYADRWRSVQTAFVDTPSKAVGDADQLVTEVMNERGYPVDDFDKRAADISVDHPTVVENYRAGHAIHLAQRYGDVGTEAQRQAFVHYRALFEKLLYQSSDQITPQHTGTNREAHS